jgi:rod shape-determining protein MreD
MSVLAPAVGAVLAAILESSVLTQLQAGSVRLDLVFAVGVAVAMVLGFEAGVTWAFVGGVTLDLLLPGRVLGSTALTLLLVIAAALLVARVLWPPRLLFIATTAFVLTLAYQLIVLGLLAFTAGIGLAGISAPDLLFIALLDAIVAGAAVPVLRALDLRFGETERLAW